MKKILVVGVNWVGDTVFSLPVYDVLKENYPGADIWSLAVPRVVPVLESSPSVDGIMVYDERGRHRNLRARWALAAEIRAQHFDAVFILRKSRSRSLLVWLAGIPLRAGYSTPGGLLTHQVPSRTEEPHRRDDYLHVLRSVGIESRGGCPRLEVGDAVRKECGALLARSGIKEGTRFMVLNPGGNWMLKRWPASSWAALLQALGKRYGADMSFVFSGAPADRELADGIIRDAGVDAVNLAGKVDLKHFLGVLAEAELFISADSGPLHLAGSLGTDSVALFGPTRPEATGPLGPGRADILQKDTGCNRAPCYFLECPDNVCMKAIGPEDVVDAVNRMLGGRAGGRPGAAKNRM